MDCGGFALSISQYLRRYIGWERGRFSCEDVAIGMFMFDIKAFEDAFLVIYLGFVSTCTCVARLLLGVLNVFRRLENLGTWELGYT